MEERVKSKASISLNPNPPIPSLHSASAVDAFTTAYDNIDKTYPRVREYKNPSLEIYCYT